MCSNLYDNRSVSQCQVSSALCIINDYFKILNTKTKVAAWNVKMKMICVISLVFLLNEYESCLQKM